jgi:alpha-galactosidase
VTDSTKKNADRLAIQQEMLARHGNYAEVMVRTTPEATDMVNFARLWEHVMQEADRRCKAGTHEQNEDGFAASQQDYAEMLVQMAAYLKKVALRHKIELTGTEFIDRIAQRYNVATPQGAGKTVANSDEMEDFD